MDENERPYDVQLGDNYTVHNFMCRKGTLSGKGVTRANVYLGLAEKYIKGMNAEFEKTLENRPAVQNYLNKYTSNLKINSYYHLNEVNPGGLEFDSVLALNSYACEYVFADIIRNLDTATERSAFCGSYRALHNEAYKEGFGNAFGGRPEYEDSYNSIKNATIRQGLKNNLMLEAFDINEVYENNDFTPVCALVDQLLVKATNNMNKNLNNELTPADLRQVVNTGLAVTAMASMHDNIEPSFKHVSCSYYKESINDVMYDTFEEMLTTQTQEYTY